MPFSDLGPYVPLLEAREEIARVYQDRLSPEEADRDLLHALRKGAIVARLEKSDYLITTKEWEPGGRKITDNNVVLMRDDLLKYYPAMWSPVADPKVTGYVYREGHIRFYNAETRLWSDGQTDTGLVPSGALPVAASNAASGIDIQADVQIDEPDTKLVIGFPTISSSPFGVTTAKLAVLGPARVMGSDDGNDSAPPADTKSKKNISSLSEAVLRTWFLGQIDEGRPFSAKAGYLRAIKKFGRGRVSRDRISRLHREMAPATWARAGRRKPT